MTRSGFRSSDGRVRNVGDVDSGGEEEDIVNGLILEG